MGPGAVLWPGHVTTFMAAAALVRHAVISCNAGFRTSTMFGRGMLRLPHSVLVDM